MTWTQRRTLLANAILAVGISLASAVAGAQDRVTFRHLTIADGLSQNAVLAILQDHRQVGHQHLSRLKCLH